MTALLDLLRAVVDVAGTDGVAGLVEALAAVSDAGCADAGRPYALKGVADAAEAGLVTGEWAQHLAWAGDPFPEALAVIASLETCPADVLDRLASHGSAQVRRAVARNAAASPATRSYAAVTL